MGTIDADAGQDPAGLDPAVRDGGEEKPGVTRAQVGEGEDAVRVETGQPHPSRLFTALRREAGLHVAPEGTNGRGGEDSLRRSPDSHEDVDGGAGLGGQQAAFNISVGEEIHLRTGGARSRDEQSVPRPVLHSNDKVRHRSTACFGKPLQVLGQRRGEVKRRTRGIRDQLLHVVSRPDVIEGAARSHSEYRDRSGQVLGGQPGAVHRVDGDVDSRPATGAEPLPEVKHGGFVLLPFTDQYEPVDLDACQRVPQGDDGDAVHLVFVPRAEEIHGGEGRDPGGAGETLENVGGKAG